MNLPRPYLILLSITGILFLVLYIILSFHNRFHSDDYALLSYTKEVGVIDAVINRYNGFCARWSADTIAFSLIGFYRYNFFLPLFHTATLIALILSFSLLIKKIFAIIFLKKIDNLSIFLYSILFTTCFFFSSYNTAEVWWWYVSAWTYLWSIIAGNFLFWILLSEKLKAPHVAFIIILTAYIAGATESYSLIYIFFLVVIVFLKRKNILSIFSSKIQYNSLIVTLALLVLFYMITILAPGTWARKDILTHATCTQHIIMVMKAYGKIVLYQTPKLVPYLLLFGIPWMLFGQNIASEEKVETKKLLSPFIKSIFLISILILILILPAAWILYDIPPARALSQVSLLLSSYASFIFFYIGYKIQIPKKIFQVIIFFALILSVIVLSFHSINQYSITRKFANESYKRIKYLLQENISGRKNTVFLEPLPASGMIYCDELSSDSTFNESFEKTYNLKFHVAVKKAEQHEK
ncbi:MAG: hypothetical protein AABZ32_04565 [Bacteroidota bacterium]